MKTRLKIDAPRCLRSLLIGLLIGAYPLVPADARVLEAGQLTELSFDELLDVQILSVARKRQSLVNTAAAVFVITAEDIRRSGARRIPELLRMVPGLNVARIDAQKWAVTARGFNGRFANKLLVQQDGRTLYNPTFSGVYWEAQDTLLEDVERIEVIRGPGGSLWGANAVNGIINIVTRSAHETLGGLAVAGGGPQEREFAGLRYGAELAQGLDGRAYFQFHRQDQSRLLGGGQAGDRWDWLQGGFRLDGGGSADWTYTVQGDTYQGQLDKSVIVASPVPPNLDQLEQDHARQSGANLLGRWQRGDANGGELTLQGYLDFNRRREVFAQQDNYTFDLDLQHIRPLGERHELLWGAGYRLVSNDLGGSAGVRFSDARRTDRLFSAFAQDEIRLVPDQLTLTLGTKIEHNDYTGLEWQPSLRLVWMVAPGHSLWGAISRAVRTPSRAEHDVRLPASILPPGSPVNPTPLPVEVVTVGNPEFGSEHVVSYEAGWRARLATNLSGDLALFYSTYDRVRSNRNGRIESDFSGPVPQIILPLIFENDVHGSSWGAELAMDWSPRPWWRLQGAYSYLNVSLTDHNSGVGAFVGKTTPSNQLSLRSAMNPTAQVDVDLWLRYVSHLPQLFTTSSAPVPEVDGYWSLDARVSWRPRDELEWFVVGRNLLDPQHLEYVQESFTPPTEVGRSVYAGLRLEF